MLESAIKKSEITPSQEFKFLPCIIVASLFLPYLRGYLTLPLYGFLLLIGIDRLKLNLSDLIFFSFIALFFFIKIMWTDALNCFQIFRVYFGFFIFYVFFKQKNTLNLVNFNSTLSIVASAVICEAILINTFIDPSSLRVFPDFAITTAKTAFFGFYQRPYSIGSNASVTSFLLVIMMTLAKKQIHYYKLSKISQILSIIAVLSLLSGVGFVFLILHFLYFLKKRSLKKIMLPLLIFLILILNINFLIAILPPKSSDLFSKVQPDYIYFLFKLKFDQWGNFINSLQGPNFLANLFFGVDLSPLSHESYGYYGGDFGWIDHIGALGILGSVPFLFFTLRKINRLNIFPILLFMIASFHYATMITVVGQILFGYCLALTPKNENT